MVILVISVVIPVISVGIPVIPVVMLVISVIPTLKSTSEFDKMHAKFCIYILGVHKKPVTLQSLANLGSFLH